MRWTVKTQHRRVPLEIRHRVFVTACLPTTSHGTFSAYGADESSTCGWNECTIPQDSQSSHARLGVQSCLHPSTGHDGAGLAFQEEGTATCTEGYEAKSKVIASTTRTCHLDGCTSADAGWQFTMCFTTTVLPCFASTSPRTQSWTRRSHKLDYQRDLRRALRYWSRACLRRQF